MRSFGACFGSKQVTLLAWLHLLVIDFWQAQCVSLLCRLRRSNMCVSLVCGCCRWVALDARHSGTPAAHSIVLCFMCGPVGLLCHLLTRRVVQQRQRQ